MAERGRTRAKGVTVSGESRDGDDRPTMLDNVAGSLGFRDFLRRHRTLEAAYRALVAVVGSAIVVTGFVLIPLPGPGWLIVFAGLAVLATEFVWAERLLHYARDRVRGWSDWVRRQSMVVRGLIGMGSLAAVVVAVTVYAQVVGLPDWLPLVG